MDGKKQSSFFEELRKLATDLDRGVAWCKNPTYDYRSRAKCLNSLKAYEEEIQEKLAESTTLHEEQESSLLKYERLFGLVDAIVDQQREILRTQETYMEQYGYIPYEKRFPGKQRNQEENTEEEPELEAEAASTPEKNLALENAPKADHAKEESPSTPKLEDYHLSHYTLAQLQNPKMCINYPTMECMATPKEFQHNGLFMSPDVLGKMPPLYTPDVMHSASSFSFRWPGSAASLTRSNTSFFSSKKIRKNLQMEMNTEDTDILNQCPRAPVLSSQNLNLDIYQLPVTPQSAVKPTPRKPSEFLISRPKDYLNEELPQPPKLDATSLFYQMTIKDKPKFPSEVRLSSQNTKSDLKTPSPPILHTTFSNLEEMDAAAESVLSCRKSKKKELEYFDIDLPKPPELTGVYNFSTNNKENFKNKK